jgi:hypothetical protein
MRHLGWWLAPFALGACGETDLQPLALSEAAVDAFIWFEQVGGISGESKDHRPGDVAMMTFEIVNPQGDTNGVVRAYTSCDPLPCKTSAFAARADFRDFNGSLQHHVPIHLIGFDLRNEPWRGLTFVRPNTSSTDAPVESMSINFTKISVDYTPNDPNHRWTKTNVELVPAPACIEASDCALLAPPPLGKKWACIDLQCTPVPTCLPGIDKICL